MVHWTNSNLYIFFLKKYIRFKSESFAGIMRIASPFPIELDREQPSYVCSRLYGFFKKKMLCKNNSKQSFTADHPTPLELFFSYRVNNILVYRSVSCFFCLLVFIRLLKAPVLSQHNSLLPRPVGEDRKHWPWFATLLDLTTLVFLKKRIV